MGPELSTARLKLRSWHMADAEDGWRIYSDPEVTRFLGEGKPMTSMQELRTKLAEWIAKYSRPEWSMWGAWAMEVLETHQVVGMGLLKPSPGPETAIEVGWHLGREHWGQGFATEAGSAILRYAFETCQLDEVLALIRPENIRSAGVAQRLGMKLVERTARFNGLDCDVWKIQRIECSFFD